MKDVNYMNLPGGNIVQHGLADLASSQPTIPALLVSIGSPRLEQIGIHVPSPISSPEFKLYKTLSAMNPDSAHSQYNGWIRKLVSFERAAECVK